MEKDEIKKRLEKEENVIWVSMIHYNNKQFIKTMKSLKNGIEYIYYEVENNSLKKVEEEVFITYFRNNYECKPSDIIE